VAHAEALAARVPLHILPQPADLPHVEDAGAVNRLIRQHRLSLRHKRQRSRLVSPSRARRRTPVTATPVTAHYNSLTARHDARPMSRQNFPGREPVAEAQVPREAFRAILGALSKTPFHDLPLTERGSWLPADVREAVANGWLDVDGPSEGMFGQPVKITETGRHALKSMPYPPFRR